jgi:NAD(P)-dependent dehydrogenase (short-subunit alcohol dehydrogenase family)
MNRQIAMVVGASAGLGRAVAVRLATDNTPVVAVDRDETGLPAHPNLLTARSPRRGIHPARARWSIDSSGDLGEHIGGYDTSHTRSETPESVTRAGVRRQRRAGTLAHTGDGTTQDS